VILSDQSGRNIPGGDGRLTFSHLLWLKGLNTPRTPLRTKLPKTYPATAGFSSIKVNQKKVFFVHNWRESPISAAHGYAPSHLKSRQNDTRKTNMSTI
jgi:hypothetical protein